ncbi:hypothetical protein RND81_06G132500 [Saponaria officinalis]|uniref:F-box domain-containing protein n=1 Tax=Saponaria officinalis TaxID=3572 RepID=A0AAW1K9L1_SAPOF
MADSSPETRRKIDSLWPEILKRVLAKQLGICMCVSKKWNSLISSQTFISSHTNFISQTHQKSPNLFIIRTFSKQNPQKDPKESYLICSETLKTLETLKTQTKKTFICPFKTKSGLQFRMVGSVNGVIFLSDDYFGNTYTYILWNPLVNCFIQLPKPRVCFKAIGPYMNVFGVGYDCLRDDYKVIRVVYPQRNDGLDETPPLAELYSVKDGKWRSVSAENVGFCTIDLDWSVCFLRGSVHWVAYERFGVEKEWSHKSNLLLLFNVEKERFQIMRLPLELRDVCLSSLMVSECQGMLCVTHCVLVDNMLTGELVEFNLWVKKEYNQLSSWSKFVSVDVHGRLHKFVHLRKNGELIVSSKDNELLSYDPETKNAVVLAQGCPSLYDACSFVETLAFLNKDCKKKSYIWDFVLCFDSLI